MAYEEMTSFGHTQKLGRYFGNQMTSFGHTQKLGRYFWNRKVSIWTKWILKLNFPSIYSVSTGKLLFPLKYRTNRRKIESMDSIGLR